MMQRKRTKGSVAAMVVGLGLALLSAGAVAGDVGGYRGDAGAPVENRPNNKNPMETRTLVCVYEVRIGDGYWDVKQFEMAFNDGTTWCPTWWGTGRLVGSYWR